MLQENPKTAVLCRQLYAHPGEIEAARAFAVAQQRRLLEVLPTEFQERVTVTATVCTDFTTFTYNQPAILAHPGALASLGSAATLRCWGTAVCENH